MKIIVLSTSLPEAQYNLLYGLKREIPNPASENFYQRMISSLAKESEIVCLSLIDDNCREIICKNPINESNCRYDYVYNNHTFCSKVFLPKRIEEKVSKELENESAFIIYDSLNVHLAKAAHKLKKRFPNLKTIAVLTDDPRDISFVNSLYKSSVLKLSNKADASLSLTKSLINTFGLNYVPSFPLLGFVDREDVEPIKDKDYIYYGGALFEKDGTNDLLNLYKQYKGDTQLIISGHGPAEKDILEAQKNDKRIRYLGQLKRKEHLSYIAGAKYCVFPRHFSPKLDSACVPSKLLEYLAYGEVVLATKSSLVFEKYKDNINEIPSKDGSKGIVYYLKDVLEGKVSIKQNKGKQQIKDDLDGTLFAKKFLNFLSLLNER